MRFGTPMLWTGTPMVPSLPLHQFSFYSPPFFVRQTNLNLPSHRSLDEIMLHTPCWNYEGNGPSRTKVSYRGGGGTLKTPDYRLCDVSKLVVVSQHSVISWMLLRREPIELEDDGEIKSNDDEQERLLNGWCVR